MSFELSKPQQSIRAKELTEQQIMLIQLGELQLRLEVEDEEDFRVVEENRLFNQPITTLATLSHLLARSDYWLFRLIAAYHLSDPVLLERLASDPDPRVRRAVAENPRAPKANRLLLVTQGHCKSF